MRKIAILTTGLLLSGAAAAASGDWRSDATKADADRLEHLDRAWRAGLAEARKADARGLRALGALADPKAGLARPQPTPGDYRCRTIKLGSISGFIAYDWFRCRVELTPGGDLLLAKTTGSQRPSGNLYPDTAKRLVFLGAVVWGRDEGPGRYGRDPERDQIGAFERIGPNRYRLLLPWPKQESKLDIIELRR